MLKKNRLMLIKSTTGQKKRGRKRIIIDLSAALLPPLDWSPTACFAMFSPTHFPVIS